MTVAMTVAITVAMSGDGDGDLMMAGAAASQPSYTKRMWRKVAVFWSH